jgi:uracil-DNA glycosylase family 4
MSVAGAHFGSLRELRDEIGDCHRCALGDTRTTLVFGVGRPDAEVLFIGEAPGKNEDLKGEPFVGAAGKLLDELLGSAGLSRSDVYIANILKCRPPQNRDPEADEIRRCTPFLEEQIRLIDPKVIVTLGKFATQFVLETTVGITQLRGRRHEVGGRAVLPIFHPAAALYDQTKRQILLDDFQRLRVLLESERERRVAAADAAPTIETDGVGAPASGELAASAPASGASAKTPEPQQDTLF